MEHSVAELPGSPHPFGNSSTFSFDRSNDQACMSPEVAVEKFLEFRMFGNKTRKEFLEGDDEEGVDEAGNNRIRLSSIRRCSGRRSSIGGSAFKSPQELPASARRLSQGLADPRSPGPKPEAEGEEVEKRLAFDEPEGQAAGQTGPKAEGGNAPDHQPVTANEPDTEPTPSALPPTTTTTADPVEPERVPSPAKSPAKSPVKLPAPTHEPEGSTFEPALSPEGAPLPTPEKAREPTPKPEEAEPKSTLGPEETAVPPPIPPTAESAPTDAPPSPPTCPSPKDPVSALPALPEEHTEVMAMPPRQDRKRKAEDSQEQPRAKKPKTSVFNRLFEQAEVQKKKKEKLREDLQRRDAAQLSEAKRKARFAGVRRKGQRG